MKTINGYLRFIKVPPRENQITFIENVLNKEDAYDLDDDSLKSLFYEAVLHSRRFRYYQINTVNAFYSGYSSHPVCIVKALDLETAIKIAIHKNMIDPNDKIDHDLGNMSRSEIHNPAGLPVIALKVL